MTGQREGPLLSVKHVVPPPRPGALQRERLHRLLLDAGPARLRVVVAPAGSGKTTLLGEWANDPRETRGVAWVSLDPSDDEPVRFWTYVVMALRSVRGDLGARALSALAVPGVDPVAVALPTLVEELSGSSDAHVLVLDDYHVIRDARIHEGLEFLLGYLPPTLCLVVAGRADPPLPLARLRARGDLVEIRGDALGFTVEESASMLATVSGVELDDETVGRVRQRTEGWAAGLQLAGITLRGSPDPVATAAQLRGDDRHILDYFSEEVVATLPADQRDLLIRTSPLDRLCGSLCDAVLQRTGSAEVLADLDRANVFVVPLDRRREWYRCHSLFRDVLRQELDARSDGPTSELLGRAADWYAASGHVDDAVRCRLAAADEGGAEDLLAASEAWFFEQGAAATYLELGERLAEVRDPAVSLMLAYAAVLSGRFDRVQPWCDATSALVTDATALDGWSSARAAVLTMRAAYGHDEEDDPGEALAEAGDAVALERDPDEPGYVAARVALGSALLRAERFGDAVEVLLTAWTCPSRALLPSTLVLQTGGLLALTLVLADRDDDARALVEDLAGDAEAAETAWGDAAAAATTWIRLVEGRTALAAGAAVEARDVLARAVRLATVWGRDTYQVMALTALAEAELATGDRAAAGAALTRARDLVSTERVRPRAVRELEAVETRVGRGAVRAARRAGRIHEELTDRELAILRVLPGAASRREIADALFLSVNTVKGYTRSLYRKLGATSRQEAVAEGRALGLI